MSIEDLRKSKRGYKKEGKEATPWQARPGTGEDGKRGPTRCFHTKGEAEEYVAGWVTAKRRGESVDVAAGKVTFREYAEEWLALQAHRPDSSRAVASRLRNHAYPVFGDVAVAKIRTSHIQAMVKRMSLTLAPSMIKHVYGNVRSVFAAAVLDRAISQSPCPPSKQMKLPRQDRDTKITPLTYEQVMAIAEAVPPRWYALVTVAAGLGLRPSEMTGLKVGDIDFLRRVVRVQQQLQHGKLVALKTASSYRTIPLPESVAFELAEHLSKYAVINEDDLVFTTDSHGSIPETTRSDMWRKAADSVGLPRARMHDTRHFYASALIASGASVVTVQACLGHATATETLNTYAHLWPGAEDGTRRAIDEVFSRSTARSEERRGSLGGS